MGYPIITRKMYNVLNFSTLKNTQYFHKWLLISRIEKITGDDKIPHKN
jgi:hypothetical protein